MELTSLIALFFVLTLLILILTNYNLFFRDVESFDNNFTESKCCCDSNEINKCNSQGMSCVCDYYEKNKYLCQPSY